MTRRSRNRRQFLKTSTGLPLFLGSDLSGLDQLAPFYGRVGSAWFFRSGYPQDARWKRTARGASSACLKTNPNLEAICHLKRPSS
jgi:hypothetical protein